MNRRPKRVRTSAKNSYEALEPRQLLATLSVTTPLDVIDATDGLTSLREAIIESNSNGQDDVIVLGAETFVLGITGISEDNAATGDLDILPDSLNRLTIRGAGHHQTVIDGQQIDRVFQIFEDSVVTIEDLHITGGSDAQQPTSIGRRGGGIFMNNSTMTLNRIRMTDNDTGSFGVGGAVYIAGGSYDITDSFFVENLSDSAGSAIFARQADGTILQSSFDENTITNTFRSVSSSTIESREGSLLIKDSSLVKNFRGINTINGSLDVQGTRFIRQGESTNDSHQFFKNEYAIASDGTTVNISDAKFVANEKAVEFKGVDSFLTVTRTLFHGNFRSLIFEGHSATVIGSTFQRQTGGIAGAIELNSISGADFEARVLTVEDSLFQFNFRAGIRGGIATTHVTGSRFFKNAGEGGISLVGDLFVRDSEFENNLNSHGIRQAGSQFDLIRSVVRGNADTGVNSQQSGLVLISHSEITNNKGRALGGGLRFSPFFPESEIVISNSLIAENTVEEAFDGAEFADGGAISIDSVLQPTKITIASSTIVKNRADRRGGVFSVTPTPREPLELEFRNSIVWGNQAPVDPLVTVAEISTVGFHSYFSDSTAGDGVIPFGGAANNNQDRFPRFLDWAGGDYHLAASSPAINAGDNSLLERDSRDVDEDENTIEFAPDLELRGRALQGITDIGAFEFRV